MLKHLTLVGMLLACTLAAPAEALVLKGKVVRVSDGDSLTILFDGIKERIRLVGIDAPEKDQPVWGARSTDYLARLAMGKQVRVETDPEARDKYGKVLGYVYVGATMLNLDLLTHGYAMLYNSPKHAAFRARFTAAQAAARKARLNIWAKPSGIEMTPYEYRHPGQPLPGDIGQGRP